MQKLPRAFAHYSLPFWPGRPQEPPDDVMRAQLSFTLLPSSLSQPPAFSALLILHRGGTSREDSVSFDSNSPGGRGKKLFSSKLPDAQNKDIKYCMDQKNICQSSHFLAL